MALIGSTRPRRYASHFTARSLTPSYHRLYPAQHSHTHCHPFLPPSSQSKWTSLPIKTPRRTNSAPSPRRGAPSRARQSRDNRKTSRRHNTSNSTNSTSHRATSPPPSRTRTASRTPLAMAMAASAATISSPLPRDPSAAARTSTFSRRACRCGWTTRRRRRTCCCRRRAARCCCWWSTRATTCGKEKSPSLSDPHVDTHT